MGTPGPPEVSWGPGEAIKNLDLYLSMAINPLWSPRQSMTHFLPEHSKVSHSRTLHRNNHSTLWSHCFAQPHFPPCIWCLYLSRAKKQREASLWMSGNPRVCFSLLWQHSCLFSLHHCFSPLTSSPQISCPSVCLWGVLWGSLPPSLLPVWTRVFIQEMPMEPLRSYFTWCLTRFLVAPAPPVA